MTSREDLLDQYIDARNAENAADMYAAGDRELQELFTTLEQVRAGGDIEWPEGDFPGRLSQSLRAELNPPGVGSAGADGDAVSTSPGGAAQPRAVDDGRASRWRWYTGQFAGMAAAAAVIGFFALGLAFILGDWGGEVQAPGAVVEPGEIPGTLLYTEYDGEQTIARIDADGTDQQELASRPALQPDTPGIAWSPDGKWVAYFDPLQREQWSPAVIRLVSADGQESQNVEMEPVDGAMRLDASLGWSYDGNSLAFVHQDPNTEKLRVSVVHREDGEVQTVDPVTEGAAPNDSSPAWAKDQWALAFTRIEEGGESGIYLIYSGMSEAMPLVTGAQRAEQPEWSPDGESIAYIGSGEDPSRGNLHVIDVDSGQTTNITNHDRTDYLPAWSSRDQIAFMSDHADRNHDIFIVNPDGSDLRNITEDYDWPAYLPNWSDDGRYLTFTSHNEDQDRWRINVYDVEQEQLFTVLESENPLFAAAWRPDAAESEPDEDAEVDSSGVTDEELELMRESAERYLSDDHSIALTVDGEDVTSGQIAMEQVGVEWRRSTMRDLVDDSRGFPEETVEYNERFIEAIDEYGVENVGLGTGLAQAAVRIYAGENDLVASDERVEGAMDQQREIWETAESEDPESAAAVGDAMIDVMGEDVYWNEYLPEVLERSLTEDNVQQSVLEAADLDTPEDPAAFGLEREIFLAEFRADLVRDADIEVVDETALGDADLDRAVEYITEVLPELRRSRQE